MGKQATTKAWSHPKLGSFAAGEAWERKLNIPEFAAFSYDTGYSNARRSTGDVTFSLSAYLKEEDLEIPTPAMIAIADRIINDPVALVQKVITALWDDFNGREPDSGIWWHGILKRRADGYFGEGGEPPPTCAQDILKVLQLYDIVVFDREWTYPKPLAFLTFHAAFEQEHGVSILTDGQAILGAGYAGEAEVWEHLRQPPPARRG